MVEPGADRTCRRRPNPWIDLLLPMSDAATFLEEVQATIAPIVPGDSFSLLLIPLRASRFTRPLFRTQDEELGPRVRPAPRPAARHRRRTGARLQPSASTTDAASSAARSTRSARVRLDVDDWAAHYGEQWPRLLAAKRRYDRDDVLASGPDIRLPRAVTQD